MGKIAMMTPIHDYKIKELVSKLKKNGFEQLEEEKLLIIRKFVRDSLYLVLDSEGIHGNICIVQDNSPRKIINNIDEFISLHKSPIDYPIINVESENFREELMSLNIGDYAILKKYRDDPDSNEHVFIRVSKQTDNHFELYDDAFDGAALWGCVGGFDDQIYKNDSVYYPVQW